MKTLKTNAVQALFIVFASVFLNLASAQGLSGLEDANTLLQEIFGYVKMIVISIAMLYFLYLIAMAFLERKTWTDVLIGLVWCIVAGGASIAAEWAVGYFGG